MFLLEFQKVKVKGKGKSKKKKAHYPVNER